MVKICQENFYIRLLMKKKYLNVSLFFFKKKMIFLFIIANYQILIPGSWQVIVLSLSVLYHWKKVNTLNINLKKLIKTFLIIIWPLSELDSKKRIIFFFHIEPSSSSSSAILPIAKILKDINYIIELYLLSYYYLIIYLLTS